MALFLDTAFAQALGTVPVGGRQIIVPTAGTQPVNGSSYSLFELANIAVAYALVIAAFLAVIFIFWGGINFILSGGKDEKVKAAVNTIRYAIIGLLIVIFSFSIVAIIGRIFGYDLISYIRFDAIVALVNRIAGR